MSVIQEAELEFGSPKSPFFTSPVVRCTSPNPALECDGFQLCDDTDDAVPHVIALGACKDAQVAWENDGESLTSVLIDILKKDPHPCLKHLMRDISYRTYETVCRLHEAWKVWKQAMQMEYSTEGNNRLSGDDADRTFGIIERENPLKAFQDPQLASHTRLDMDSPFTL
jgi:hypothetical protein